MTDPAFSGDDRLEAGLAAGFGAPRAPVLDAIERSAGTQVPRVALRDRPDGASGATPRASSEAPPELPLGRASYQLRGVLAQGGMGVLYECRDLDLGREVALKVLREDLARRPEFVRRFVEEAQIGGQLQHPGVVPVYEIGSMSDGRPYFAMELVRGRTLAKLLEEREGGERGALLEIFGSICRTVAYAHARGVVHRDLKPGNILLGSFGEVQVIDWGLAKVLASSETRSRTPAARPRIETVRSASSSSDAPSLVGSVMGTPAYMSPEQARGDVERIDERSDVFALGAMLCEILTGDPPYRGSGERAVAQARLADVRDASERLDACDAELELVDLCRDCLAPDPADRPRSAGAVSARVQDYLASLEQRARRAEVDAAEARVRARSVAALSALAALVLCGVLGFAWWRGLDRARRASIAERALASAASEANLARGRGDWAGARAALARAEALGEDPLVSREARARLALDRSAIEQEIDAAREREELARDNRRWLAELERATSPEGDEVYPSDWGALDRELSASFSAHACEVDARPLDATIAALAGRGIPIELADALDEWSNVRRRASNAEGAERLRALADALDPDPLRMDVRAARAEQDEGALLALAERARGEALPPRTLRLLAHELATSGRPELAVDLLRAAALRAPEDYALAVELGRALRACAPPRNEEALAAYRVAVALRPDSVAGWHELAMTLHPILARPNDAIAVLREARARFPGDAHLALHLGTALAFTGHDAEALPLLRTAADGEPNSALAWCNLATALLRLGRVEESIANFERALELDPRRLEAQHDLGVGLRKLGRLSEAIECFERAAELDPRFLGAQLELAYAHHLRGEIEPALEHARRACELEPSSAYAQELRARYSSDAGLWREARAAFEASLRLAPKSAGARRELALLLASCEDDAVYDPEAALVHARELAKLAGADASDAVVIALALVAGRADEEASEWIARAERERPGDGGPTLLATVCELRAGRLDEARERIARLDLEALASIEPAYARLAEEARRAIEGD